MVKLCTLLFMATLVFAPGVFVSLGQAAANLVSNPSFESPVGPVGPIPVTGTFNTGPSAGTNWSVFNDSKGGTVTTELCTTTCLSGATPPPPIHGAQMIHIVTSGSDLGDSGIFQIFGSPGTGPAVTWNSVWVWIVAGGAELGTGDQAKGGPNADIATFVEGQWVQLQAKSGAAQSPQNEIIIYSARAGASDFFATFARTVAVDAQNPMTADSPYQVKYATNVTHGDSVINITNTGARGADLGLGTTASATGAICANVYVYDPSEAVVSCCSCPVTPNGLVSLSAQHDLINNPLTRGNPTSIVIKLLATVPVGGTCNNSALLAGVTLASLPTGMAAWGTTLHIVRSGAPGEVTETAFTPSTLSEGELDRLAYGCGVVSNVGSGFGICNSCRLGGLGAARQ